MTIRTTIGILSFAAFLVSCSPDLDRGQEQGGESPSSEIVEDAGGASGRESSMSKPPAAGPVKIMVTAENWKFTPAVIRVKKGQKVALSLEGKSGVHGFSAPTLGINTKVALGTTTTITLPTDFAGNHTFFCSIPCGAGHKDMYGQIVIEE